MKTFASRLRRNLALAAVAAGVLLFVAGTLAVSLRPGSLYSGWLLVPLMVTLAAYNLFKKVPFLPLGASSAWLQLHIYLGLLTILVFVLHAGLHFPRGPLGWILETLFVGVAGSGLVGLLMSRAFPALLRARGEEVIFEQIPVRRLLVRERVEQLVLDAAGQVRSTLIADFYRERLRKFFDGPRNFWRHVFRVSRHAHGLLTEIDAQDRYLNDKERQIMHEVRALVKEKDDLDFQHALQAMLKYWLFAHIPLTYSLLLFAAFHVLVVYAYSGVIR
jgi:hypothetical protein